MTLTSSKVIGSEWSSGVSDIGTFYYGAMDEHIPVRNGNRGVVRFALDWSGVYKVTSAQLVFTLTTGVHGSAHYDSHYVIQRVTSSVPVKNQYEVICGGAGWRSDAAFTYTDWCEGWLPSINNYWSYGVDITPIINNWAPWYVLRSDGGGGPGAANYGLSFGSTGGFEIWSQTAGTRTGSTSYRPYINLYYETSANRAPNAPWVYDVGGYGQGAVIPNNTSPVVTAVCTGDADNDPVSGMSFRWAQTSGYGVESWSTGYGESGSHNFWNDGNYRANITLSGLTAGRWYNFQTTAWDHHGAGTGWTGTQWNYLNAPPNAPVVS